MEMGVGMRYSIVAPALITADGRMRQAFCHQPIQDALMRHPIQAATLSLSGLLDLGIRLVAFNPQNVTTDCVRRAVHPVRLGVFIILIIRFV